MLPPMPPHSTSRQDRMAMKLIAAATPSRITNHNCTHVSDPVYSTGKVESLPLPYNLLLSPFPLSSDRKERQFLCAFPIKFLDAPC